MIPDTLHCIQMTEPIVFLVIAVFEVLKLQQVIASSHFFFFHLNSVTKHLTLSHFFSTFSNQLSPIVQNIQEHKDF